MRAPSHEKAMNHVFNVIMRGDQTAPVLRYKINVSQLQSFSLINQSLRGLSLPPSAIMLSGPAASLLGKLHFVFMFF